MPNTAFRSFVLDWRVKVAAFWVFDALPGGHALYLQTQKRITKTVPRRLSPTAETAACFADNWRSIVEHLGIERAQCARILEFGAGWDLYSNLVMWCLGANDQLVYDLNRWAAPEQLNLVIRHLKNDPPPGFRRTPERELPEAGDWETALRDAYGITYRAPADVTDTRLDAGCVDAIVSTSVLEHVPEPAAARILMECGRILRDEGVMSHCIDYSDHYAHSDATITPYNFLRFTPKAWRLCNPDIHFQNRMRHAEHRKAFELSGFHVAREVVRQPDDADALLSRVPLATEFDARPKAELLPLYGQFVLTKRPQPEAALP